jgi:hypothetical protein
VKGKNSKFDFSRNCLKIIDWKRKGNAGKSQLKTTINENNNSFHFSTFVEELDIFSSLILECDGDTVRIYRKKSPKH